jgi:hypothetical protein
MLGGFQEALWCLSILTFCDLFSILFCKVIRVDIFGAAVETMQSTMNA